MSYNRFIAIAETALPNSPILHFSAHNLLSFNIFSNVTAAYLVFFVRHTVLHDLFQMIACFYTVEQCSAIDNLSIASTLQLSMSRLSNSKLCVTLGDMQKLFSLI